MTDSLKWLEDIFSQRTKGPWPKSYGPIGQEDGPWHHVAWGPEHEEGEDGDHDEADKAAHNDAAFIATVGTIGDLLLEVAKAADDIMMFLRDEPGEPYDLDRVGSEMILDHALAALKAARPK